MHVADGPVGVVREVVHRADGQQRAFEGGHPVEGHARDEKLDHRVGAQFIPCPAQGQQAVQHAAPGRRPEHQREEHAEVLQPLRQRRVQQVVRPGPDVDEDQRPEVHDRQAIGIHRPLRRLRHEIIHDAQNRRRQEEGHRVVAVPPLHQRVLHPGENPIAVQRARRNRQVVHDVEHRHRDDGRDVEPQRHVEARLVALGQRPEKVDGKDHPDHRHQDIDRPDQLRVLLAARQPQRQGHRRQHDDDLPAPEMQPAQEIARRRHLAQPLRRVVNPREHHVPDEREDRRVRVQRAQPPEGQEFQPGVQLPVPQLPGDEDPGQQADRPPDHGGPEEVADRFVLVSHTHGAQGPGCQVGGVGGIMHGCRRGDGVGSVSGNHSAFTGTGVRRGCRFVVGKRQEALALKRGVSPPHPFDGEGDNEKDCQQAAEKNGKG